MDENTKKTQREIAKDKVQIVLAGLAVAVLVIMELYIMINFKSNFIAMAIGILLMIVALFFLISALMDVSLKTKDIEQEKYEEIYNAQKASYLVIKKSFDEMEERLRNIEENSSLPAEDIINAQKAVAKVTITRSKENTDALMNSNDELINQIFSIRDKLESSNSELLEKQQAALKATNDELQQKIAALTAQISNIEGKLQNGIQVATIPVVQMPIQEPVSAPITETELQPIMEEVAPESIIEEPIIETAEEPAIGESITENASEVLEEEITNEESSVEEMPIMEEIPSEEVVMEEAIPAIEPESVPEEVIAEEEAESLTEESTEETESAIDEVLEEPVDDLGLDLDNAVSEESEVDDLGLDLDAQVEEEAPEQALEEVTEEIVDDLGIDLDSAVEDEVGVEVEPEPMPEEPVAETELEPIAEEPVVETEPEPIAEEPLVEAESEPVVEEPVEEAEPETVEAEPEVAAEEPAQESTPIPDVGVDLSDPNRVMSAEEIEKLFASI